MASGQRPLSELSPVAQRRNSPSWNQNTKTMVGSGSSHFNSSPMNSSTSPRLFWKGRDAASPFRSGAENRVPYDPEFPTSPSKRASIENLKRASRVKNSSLMFSRESQKEHDPANAQPLDRPLAGRRPFGLQFHKKTPALATGSDARRQLPSQLQRETATAIQGSLTGVDRSNDSGSKDKNSTSSGSPSKNQQTPTKSSLTKNGRYSGRVSQFDPAKDIWSDEESGTIDGSLVERSSNRQCKSVTFDAAPPQINEYEMTTPVPSTVASSPREGSYDSYDGEDDSFEQDNSMVDDSFDASLEDTDKTPVVLPEDWRFLRPDSVDGDSIHDKEDPFYNDYEATDRESTPGSVQEPNPLRPRVESMDSNGERRPLPPLPGVNAHQSPNSSLMSALERASNSSRAMPSPLKPASCTKADIASLATGSMSLEDRLRLMMTRDRDDSLSEIEKQRERKLRRANAKERSVDREGDSGLSFASGESERELSPDILATPPHISRESILREIKREDVEDHDMSNISGSQYSRSSFPLDPDMPIPSLEHDDDHANDDEISIKEEDDDDHDINLYDIPEYYNDHFEQDNVPEQSSSADLDDGGSCYSRDQEDNRLNPSDVQSDGLSTPIPNANSTAHAASPSSNLRDNSPVSSIDAEHQLDADFFGNAERSISPLEGSSTIAPHIDMASLRNSLQRPHTPQEEGDGDHDDKEQDPGDAPPSPQSVIRHPVSESPQPDTIPEHIATVKATETELKTRPSLTPADAETMAAACRKVSCQNLHTPQVQEQDHEDESTSVETEDSQATIEAASTTEQVSKDTKTPIQEKRLCSLVKLDIPVDMSEEGLGFGLDEEFDRVIEAQKRGYLMRQNTKVIVASNRPESAGADGSGDVRAPGQVGVSPRKASQPTWTTEPWNPKSRRQSIKMAGAVARKKVGNEAVPPLPGHESNAKDAAAEQYEEDYEDGQERGRLFVKVVGVKNLDLPLPRSERSYFSLTLDNGIHCVTTSWLELGKSAPIGQEFELVVLNDLEFQLTLQMKLDPPKLPKVQPASPQVKPQKPQKTSAFSRVFVSPKKRREMELKQQMEAQKQQKADEMNQAINLDPWHQVRNLVAKDGSFARAYVSLAEYESRAYGRPLSVDVACFNEWAVEEVTNSVKSKRGAAATTGPAVQRRPPYHIGYLELQLLYVPKPKGATDDDMPKSMNACIREMREADNAATRSWEGFLSQQGGDCPYWRRRYFKLQGTKLTAYHEITRQPRATINLSKAVKLVDDKSILTQKETSAKNGGRRKSAFAEEEEGYMFVEEGFRIRFANGECIDFYADSASDKEGWMKVLGETIGRGSAAGNGKARAWTELVLKRERSLAAKKDSGDRRMSKGTKAPPPLTTSAPPAPPAKESLKPQVKHPMAPPPKPRHQHHQSEPEAKPQATRHQKTRSLIF
ncbi:hypothetical protein VTO42DRAFT_9033 [Malbranchea cinnamomea]